MSAAAEGELRPPLSTRSLLGSVRVRLTVGALVVVSLTLALGGAGLLWLLQRSLDNGVLATATAEAADAARLESAGASPATMPARVGTEAQVVTAAGHVVSASGDLVGAPPVSTVRPGVGRRDVGRTAYTLHGDDDPDLLVATTVLRRHRPLTVYVVASDESVEDSTHDLGLALLVVLPLLAVGSGVLTWLLAGRALRPVEAIRAEVADISARDLHRRVPEPAIQDEVGRLARTMNAMLGRLEVSRDRRNQFVSDASHELRSPLSAIMTQVEVARARPDAAAWPEVAEAVADEGARLGRLIDDLLLLARRDEGQLVAGHDPVDLDELVLAEAERLRLQRRVAVDLRDVSAGRVTGDRDQLRRVVANLAENAERHAHGRVGFELGQRDGWVELVVADDGPGIAAAERERIFERFARIDEARDRPTGGTGLGLAIVGEIVAVHGGSVVVADGPPGARLVVRLPAAG